MICLPKQFETERLELRLPQMSDAAWIFESYATDSEVTRYLAWKTNESIAETQAFLKTVTQLWEQGGDGHYAYVISIRSSATPIGMIGITPSAFKASFGYVIAKRWWGHGFTAEALSVLVDWSLAQPSIYRAWAVCDVDNPASARVMEKAGMVKEGVLRRWHQAPNISDQPRDCIVCAKIK
jgi:[ribosomal protein S5]-alanine N-acetyltransferase